MKASGAEACSGPWNDMPLHMPPNKSTHKLTGTTWKRAMDQSHATVMWQQSLKQAPVQSSRCMHAAPLRCAALALLCIAMAC